MTDAFTALVERIGKRCAGGLWPAVRGQVAAWLRDNPAEVDAIKAELRAAVREGRL